MKNSTTSKRSTGSDTATKKNESSHRWLNLTHILGDKAPVKENLMLAYWGHPEPRITGLTLKIMGVNAAALLMLLIGILYLGQYQNELIKAKLETFGAEVQLISAAVSEAAIMEPDRPAWQAFDDNEPLKPELSESKARQMAHRFGRMTNRRIYIFDHSGQLIADSTKLDGPGGKIDVVALDPPIEKDQEGTLKTLKDMAGWVLKLLPQRQTLPLYRETNSQNAQDYTDALYALNGANSISVWHNRAKKIILSAASPVRYNDGIAGAILMTRLGHDIEQDIGKVWLNILVIFGGTLVITTLLSIYLSGVIARPLRRLAKAAETVRAGKSGAVEIPDLSARNDEIGELSIALRQMTNALWERMSAIEHFAADVSHELKNPLTSLRSAVETLSIVKTPEDKQKLMGIITHDLERLDRLISDISKASRLDTELSREALQNVDLKTVLYRLVERHKDPLERKQTGNIKNLQWSNTARIENHTLILIGPEDSNITVPGRDTRLTQVFENLITNALSFSPENGKVIISVSQRMHHVLITVEDQGPGIPESKLETVFERFYSERPQHEEYGQHSGLGLSICRQIINALGGRISAENAKDAKGNVTGARFSIILPSL